MKNTKHIREFIKTNKNVSGIYAIICTKTWRSYVGSSINTGKRIESHMTLLKKGTHENSDIQLDFNTYGPDCFYSEILEFCSENDLLSRESIWFNIGCNLYNKTPSHREINFREIDTVRFWRYVNKGHDDECWNWTGAKDKDSYGRMGFVLNGKKRMFRANRLAYFITNPDHNQYLIVRHTCNNTKCCNPQHLILGSYSENRKDTTILQDNKLNKELADKIRNIFLEDHHIKREDLKIKILNKVGVDLNSGILMDLCYNKFYYDPNYIVPKRYIDSEVAHFIRKLGNGKSVTIEFIIDEVNKKYKLSIKNNSVWRALKNERYIDNSYTFNNCIVVDKQKVKYKELKI